MERHQARSITARVPTSSGGGVVVNEVNLTVEPNGFVMECMIPLKLIIGEIIDFSCTQNRKNSLAPKDGGVPTGFTSCYPDGLRIQMGVIHQP